MVWADNFHPDVLLAAALAVAAGCGCAAGIALVCGAALDWLSVRVRRWL